MSRTTPTRKAATIVDVAQLAKVSTATVSRVINGSPKPTEQTREKVRSAMAQLGYIPNAQGRALVGAKSRLVGVIVDQIVDPFFAHIAWGVQREAALQGRLSLVCSAHAEEGGEIAFIDLLLQQRADLVILVGGSIENSSYARELAEHAKALQASGSRLVLCGRPRFGEDEDAPLVTYDNAGGATAVTEHLISQGHRDILYLGGPADYSAFQRRLAGYREALEIHGIPVRDELVRQGGYTQEWGRDELGRALDEGVEFTAVFGANDLIAAGVYDQLRMRGLRVPDDVSVVGYDNNTLLAENLMPPLTTVRIPLTELGRQAVIAGLDDSDALLEDQVLTVEVIIRESVAPPRAN